MRVTLFARLGLALQLIAQLGVPSCAALPPGPAAAAAEADPNEADIIKSLPSFDATSWPFSAYSGFLNVSFSPAINGYDGAVIHYQFQTSQGDAAADPVVAWHTGGPGGSSVYGQWAEAGYFQVSEEGTRINPYAWNRVANMLYLESPAGAFLTPDDRHSGFSYCTKAGERQGTCHWDDVTQAEAYAHTLRAFFAKFPTFAKHDLYLAGESYAGQYIPNIATHLLSCCKDELLLKGIAVGNGCWGGDATHVSCNGDHEDQMDAQLYHGKGLLSQTLYDEITAACPENKAHESLKCAGALLKMDRAVGPHNVYNVYDNCPGGAALSGWLEASGKSVQWLKGFVRKNMQNPEALGSLSAMGGGYDWTCGQFAALPKYFARKDVRAALNLPATSRGSTFAYTSSGPASVTLYPGLIKAGLRVLIYNGDADSCVPFIGNEQWTSSMASSGVVQEQRPWHPWFVANGSGFPVGYATGYSSNFTFVTIKLAGHQVPKNMPIAAFSMFRGFLDGREF